MSLRPALLVRDATLDDVEAVTQLCLVARRENIATTQVCTPDPQRVSAQIRGLLGEPSVQVMVCCHEERMYGLVITRFIPVNPFYDIGRIQIEAMFVDPAQRRKGAGHALLERVASVAAAAGAGEVVCVPLSGSRSAQRFFARLGFAPAGGYRIIATDSLTRKFASDGVIAGPTQRKVRRARGVDELIAVRRRRRGDTGELPVVRPDQPGRPTLDVAR